MTHRFPSGEMYQLTLEAMASDDAPGHKRLARLLKLIGRNPYFAFRCREAIDVTPYPNGPPQTNAVAAGGCDAR